MAKHRMLPEVNAGSMADIAFLLLIFFLVTASIETDTGINRKLPSKNQPPPPKIKERNILRVSLNGNNELLVEDNLVQITELKNLAIDFLDNGGKLKGEEGHCDYCKGNRHKSSSDNPIIAVIALKSNREATYAMYVSVQDQLGAAYAELRNREALRLYGTTYSNLKSEYDDPYTSDAIKFSLKKKIETVRDMYPQKISEAKTKTK